MEFDGYKEGAYYVVMLSCDYLVMKVDKITKDKDFDGNSMYAVYLKHGGATYINTYSRFSSQTYGTRIAEIHNTKYMNDTLKLDKLPEDL